MCPGSTLHHPCARHSHNNVYARDAATQCHSNAASPSNCDHHHRCLSRSPEPLTNHRMSADCSKVTTAAECFQLCSCPNSPKEVVRSAERARSRIPSASLQLPATNKKILKNPISRSASVRDARSSASSVSDGLAGGGSASVAGHPDPVELIKLRDRIAQAEVFLEAIGNATTIRNYNSSRYVSRNEVVCFRIVSIPNGVYYHRRESTLISNSIIKAIQLLVTLHIVSIK